MSKFSRNDSPMALEWLSEKIQTFKMMYNVSMLRHWFSNERWGGGGGGALNHLPLLFLVSSSRQHGCLHDLYKVA